MRDTIIAPIITEKSMKDAKLGKFTFKVNKNCSKPAIKQAIENLFGVHVLKSFTQVVKGKSKRSGKKRLEKTETSWKKAIVKLKTGEKIDAFEIGQSS